MSPLIRTGPLILLFKSNLEPIAIEETPKRCCSELKPEIRRPGTGNSSCRGSFIHCNYRIKWDLSEWETEAGVVRLRYFGRVILTS